MLCTYRDIPVKLGQPDWSFSLSIIYICGAAVIPLASTGIGNQTIQWTCVELCELWLLCTEIMENWTGLLSFYHICNISWSTAVHWLIWNFAFKADLNSVEELDIIAAPLPPKQCNKIFFLFLVCPFPPYPPILSRWEWCLVCSEASRDMHIMYPRILQVLYSGPLKGGPGCMSSGGRAGLPEPGRGSQHLMMSAMKMAEQDTAMWQRHDGS